MYRMDDDAQPGWWGQPNTRPIKHSGLFGPIRSDKEEEEESDDEEEKEGSICLSDNLPSELLQQIFKLLPFHCLLAVGKVKCKQVCKAQWVQSLGLFGDH